MQNNNVEFYKSNRSVANNNYEIDKYVASLNEHIRCAREIERILRSNYNGFKLEKDTAKDIISEFGYDRTLLVLANSVQKRIHDNRIDKECREWASSIYVPKDMAFGINITEEYVVNSDTGLLNIIVKQAKKLFEELNLFSSIECNDTTGLDFTNKIMVLKPNAIADENKTRDNQIILCTSGFGCVPTTSIKKVFGMQMKEAKICQYFRHDFIGELKEENYPNWLKEKLSQTQSYDNSSQNMEQSM